MYTFRPYTERVARLRDAVRDRLMVADAAKSRLQLEALKKYLDANFAFTKEYLSAHLPKARFAIPEATYLAWVDLSDYFAPGEDLPDFFAYKAGVLLEGGDTLLVGNANRFVRLNLAMPRSVLRTGLERMRDAINARDAE